MTVTKIESHGAEAIERMHDIHKGRPLIELLVEICASPADALEDAFYQLLTERFIESATGAQLDLIGKIVTERRQGRSDEDFRRFIRARIATNNSEGLISDFIRVTRAVLGDSEYDVHVQGDFPAALTVSVGDKALSESVGDILISFLRDTRLGGVRVLMYSMPSEPEDMFEFGPLTTVLPVGPILAAGATSFNVSDNSDYDESGSLLIDPGESEEEIVAYTAKTESGFSGLLTTQDHTLVSIVLQYTETQGMGDATDAEVGGDLASVLE